MLQYALLHLFGYKVSIDDLKAFRVSSLPIISGLNIADIPQQTGSITPGHPEAHDTPGVEVTTGPLGQGFGNAVGLAIAQAHSAAVFNKSAYDILDNYTYVIFGDGCAMEGVASEAASLAGHLRLGKLIALYDDNHISIGVFPLLILVLADILLSDILPSDILLSDILLSDILLSDILLSDILLSDILLSDILLSDILLIADICID
jgi:hypothetical protein